MQTKKFIQSFRKHYQHDIFDNILKSDFSEVSIPGTSVKIYTSELSLFIYLKHQSMLIPSIHTIILYPTIIQTIFL